jgi:hypothetical protein
MAANATTKQGKYRPSDRFSVACADQLQTPSKTLLALSILHLLAILFTLSAIIFVFLVTNQTKHQAILPSFAHSNTPYAENKWTPETWFKAILDTPLMDQQLRDKISSRITNMVAWRWLLIPIFLADIAAFAVSAMEVRTQRMGAKGQVYEEAKQVDG